MMDARIIPEHGNATTTEHGDATTPEQPTFVGKTPEQAAEMICSRPVAIPTIAPPLL